MQFDRCVQELSTPYSWNGFHSDKTILQQDVLCLTTSKHYVVWKKPAKKDRNPFFCRKDGKKFCETIMKTI